MCGGTGHRRLVGVRPEGLSPRVRGNHPPSPSPPRPARSIPACAGEPGSLPVHVDRRWVYPRVCGGTPTRCGRRWSGGGLSPRVRGNHRQSGWVGGGGGSIPACAGEPATDTRVDGDGTVYPRVCGGTRRTSCPRWPDGGLSPRVRGNLEAADKKPLPHRSIPACAGEPHYSEPEQPEYRVYPRVCGGTRRSQRETGKA